MSSARQARSRTSSGTSASRSSSSPPARAPRWESSSRAPAEEVPSALLAAFSYDRKVLLERYVPGRDLAVSLLDSEDGTQPEVLPVVEAVPRGEDFYDFEARYEIGRTTFVCPAELAAEVTERAQELALAGLRAARLPRLRARGPDARRGHGELWVLETNAIPGFTETSLLPQAADAAGIGFDELIGRILASAS